MPTSDRAGREKYFFPLKCGTVAESVEGALAVQGLASAAPTGILYSDRVRLALLPRRARCPEPGDSRAKGRSKFTPGLFSGVRVSGVR